MRVIEKEKVRGSYDLTVIPQQIPRRVLTVTGQCVPNQCVPNQCVPNQCVPNQGVRKQCVWDFLSHVFFVPRTMRP